MSDLRNEYIKAVSDLRSLAYELRASGQGVEQIARTLHAKRREIGEEFKNLTPEDKRIIIQRYNRKAYSDELGPSVEWLRDHGKTWEQITESACRTGGKDLGL